MKTYWGLAIYIAILMGLAVLVTLVTTAFPIEVWMVVGMLSISATLYTVQRRRGMGR